MKKTLTKLILEHLKEYDKLPVGNFWEKKCGSHHFSAEQKETISGTLSRLQKNGFVDRTGSKKKATWSLTRKGKLYLEENADILADLPKEDGLMRIITFDIPEKERGKRNWLRVQLTSFGYRVLHKSVWVGKRPIPKAVIKKLGELHLLPYIHIVTIEKGRMNPLIEEK